MAQHRGTGGHVYKTAPRNFEIMALMGSFPKKGKGEQEIIPEGITDGKISFEEEKEAVEEEGEEGEVSEEKGEEEEEQEDRKTGEMGEADEELPQDGASVSDGGSEDVEYDQVLDGASGLFWQRAPAPPHRSGHHARWHPHFGVAHHHARLYRHGGMYPRLVEGSHNNSRSKTGGWWGGMCGAGHYSRGHGRRRRPLRNQHQPRPHHHQVELY